MGTSGGYHEYIGGDIMSTSRGYHEYIGGYQEAVFRSVTEHNINTLYDVCSVHRGLFSTSWDMMSTSGVS